MAENSNYTLGHTISCNMNMIHEFSAGVNGLFMNAQDVLNEGKGILNTISGIMGSIPGEALHGGLSDSIRECLSRLETCDMGMEGFVLVKKANSYVDNLYGADSSHAEKVRGCAGYFQSLIQQNIQLHMIGENGKGISSILQIIRNLKLNGSVDSQNVYNEEEEFQRKLNQLRGYNNAYTNVQDPRGRDYYQKKMSEYFEAEIQPILTKKIDAAANNTNLFFFDEMFWLQAKLAWNDVLKITKCCGSVESYQKYYKNLESDINDLQSALEKRDYNQTLEKKKIVQNMGRRLVAVSDEYVDWLWEAEVDKSIMRPYIDPEDSDEAKLLNTITLPMGVTFNDEGDNLDVIQEVMDWKDDDIEIIREKLKAGEISWVEEHYPVTEEQAKSLFKETQNNYIEDVNRNIKIYNNQNEQPTYYSQNELEAMFDYAYNNGLKEKTEGVQARDDEEQIIYYYLRKDQENGVNAVIEYGKGGTTRRINQVNLFFEGNYDYTHDSNKLKEIKEELGFYVN